MTDETAPGEFTEPAQVDASQIGATSEPPSLDDIKERLGLVRMSAEVDALSGNPAYQLSGRERLAIVDALEHLLKA